MPKTTTQSSGLKSLLAKAHAAHKDDEVKMPGGGIGLPAGIEQGVAKLIKFEVKNFEKGPNAGKPFFSATGIVLQPFDHNGVKVEGLQTRIQEPLCETPTNSRKTIDEHWDFVLNELRKLGLNTKEVDPDDIVAEDGKGGYTAGPTLLAMTAKDADAIHFRFRTWVGQKAKDGPYKDREPRVQEQWLGVTEYQETSDTASEAVVDGTAESTEGEAPWENDAANEAAQVAEAAAEESPEKEPDTTGLTEAEVTELQELGALADDPKGGAAGNKAQEKIAGRARIFNVDYENADSWTAVVEAIIEASSGAAEPAESETEAAPAQPSVGDIGYYKPAGAKKYLEVEVTQVYEKAKKLNLKDNDTEKVYKAVPMAEYHEEKPKK